MVVNLDESQLMTASNFAVSNAWATSAQLCTGTTAFCMRRYKKEDFVGHVLKHKVKNNFKWFKLQLNLAHFSANFSISLPVHCRLVRSLSGTFRKRL
jgi:hypothetical protein